MKSGSHTRVHVKGKLSGNKLASSSVCTHRTHVTGIIRAQASAREADCGIKMCCSGDSQCRGRGDEVMTSIQSMSYLHGPRIRTS